MNNVQPAKCVTLEKIISCIHEYKYLFRFEIVGHEAGAGGKYEPFRKIIDPHYKKSYSKYRKWNVENAVFYDGSGVYQFEIVDYKPDECHIDLNMGQYQDSYADCKDKQW